MATIKSFTSLQQSKKLAEILQVESADMYYSKYDTIYANMLYGSCDIQYFIMHEYTPCWSLAALLSILPQSVRLVGTPKDSYWYCECDNGNNQWRADFKSADNPVDACVEMIIKLNELKML